MRQRRFSLPAFVITIVIIIALISLTLFFSESLFQVRTITIVGDSDTVKTNEFPKYKNLLLLPVSQLKQELIASSPWVQDVEVKKQFPSTLILVIHERTAIAEYQDESNHFFLDKSGKLMPALSNKTTNSVQVLCSIAEKNAGQTVTNQLLLRGLLFLDALAQKLDTLVTKLTCRDDLQAIQLTIPDTIILIAPGSAPETTASSLQLLLKQFRIEGNRPETIDLRFEKPVLIPKGVEAPVINVPESSTEASQDAIKI